MDNTYWNIIVFVLITMAYFLAFKPKLTVDILSNPTEYAKFTKDSYFRLIIYFLVVILFQFGINTTAIINKCGGSTGKNIGAAAFLTFLPWVLIFGVVMATLIVFPGFKSAFSDVVGYFIVSSPANTVLTTLLIDPNIDNKIEDAFGNLESSDANKVENPLQPLQLQIQNGGESSKKEFQDVADAIIKLCGNMSILINQLVPTNFLDYWNILRPLMKPQYQTNSPETNELKQKLLDVVTSRDNIGEGFWYGYTALLLISVIQYNITSRGCIRDTKAMQDSYQKFLDDEKKAQEKKQSAETNYIVSQ